MNKTKERWVKEIHEKLSIKFNGNVKLVFKAESNIEKGNRYQINDKVYLLCDAIFDTPTGLFVFEFLTNENVKYRFSTKNKFFWEDNLKTGKRTKRSYNWIETFKIGKKILDKYNGKYNLFFLFAKNVDFEGTENGIYGVPENNFDSLLDEII